MFEESCVHLSSAFRKVAFLYSSSLCCKTVSLKAVLWACRGNMTAAPQKQAKERSKTLVLKPEVVVCCSGLDKHSLAC